MNKIHKVNERTLDLTKLRKQLAAGHKFICDKCNSDLIIALNLEEANKLGVMPGIYCSKDTKHLFIHFYLKEARDKMHAIFEKIDKARDKEEKGKKKE